MELASRFRWAYAAAAASICACHSSSPELLFAHHVAERAVDVGAEADHVMNGCRLGRELLSSGEPGIIHGQPHQVELVFAVEDREIRLIAQQMGCAAEQAIADVVKRSGPDARCLLADQRFQPLHHLAGGAAGEGDEHDRTRAERRWRSGGRRGR